MEAIWYRTIKVHGQKGKKYKQEVLMKSSEVREIMIPWCGLSVASIYILLVPGTGVFLRRLLPLICLRSRNITGNDLFPLWLAERSLCTRTELLSSSGPNSPPVCLLSLWSFLSTFWSLCARRGMVHSSGHSLHILIMSFSAMASLVDSIIKSKKTATRWYRFTW